MTKKTLIAPSFIASELSDRIFFVMEYAALIALAIPLIIATIISPIIL